MPFPPRIRLGDKCKQFALDPKPVRAMLLSTKQELISDDKEMEIEDFAIIGTKTVAESYRARGFDFFRIPSRTVIKVRHRHRDRDLKFKLRNTQSLCKFQFHSDQMSIALDLSFAVGLVAIQFDVGQGNRTVTGAMEHQRIGRTESGMDRIFVQFTEPDQKFKFFIHVDPGTGRFYFGNGFDDTERDECRMIVNFMQIYEETSDSGFFFEFFAPNPQDGDKHLRNYAAAFISNLRWMMRNRTNGNNTGPNYPEDLLV